MAREKLGIFARVVIASWALLATGVALNAAFWQVDGGAVMMLGIALWLFCLLVTLFYVFHRIF